MADNHYSCTSRNGHRPPSQILLYCVNFINKHRPCYICMFFFSCNSVWEISIVTDTLGNFSQITRVCKLERFVSTNGKWLADQMGKLCVTLYAFYVSLAKNDHFWWWKFSMDMSDVIWGIRISWNSIGLKLPLICGQMNAGAQDTIDSK